MSKSAGIAGIAEKPDGPRKRPPLVMLGLLLVAFAGALVLKGIEERRNANDNALLQQQRQSELHASHVRAQIIEIRTRMETMLRADKNLGAIRSDNELSRVQANEPTSGLWAEISNADELEIFAQDGNEKWYSGARAIDGLLPANQSETTVALTTTDQASSGARFQTINGARTIVACTPIAGSAISVCTSKPAPVFGAADLYTVFIYLLLLLAPTLAVTGLLFSHKKTVRPSKNITANGQVSFGQKQSSQEALPNALEGIQEFEVSGLVGCWLWAPKTRTVTLGSEAAAMLGSIHDGDHDLDTFLGLIEPGDQRNIRTALENADSLSDISVTFACDMNSRRQYFELLGGASANRFAGTILNVTDRVQAKLLSRRAEALTRTAVDAYPGPFAVWDARRRLTHWNASFVRDFNLENAKLQIGASYDYVMAEASKFVRVERPLGDDSTAREVLLNNERWIRLVDRRTSGNGMISVGLDITSLKQQEATLSRNEKKLRLMVAELHRSRGQEQETARGLAEAKGKAERASQAKSVFLASMSHELRTPLNHINGFSEMISNQVYGPVGDDRYRGYAEDILASGQHLLDVINDILDMAKIEAGKMQISTRPIDPSDAVDAAVRLIRRRASDRQISLTFDADDDLPDINGDHLAIKQMTLNLVSNAIKFTEPGGKIRVTVTHENDWIIICVTDNGAGISKEDLPRLGQPFEQAGSQSGGSSSNEGTGLGLALTKSFAEMHGGHLSLESELGVGTSVSIHFPVPKDTSGTSDQQPQTGTH